MWDLPEASLYLIDEADDFLKNIHLAFNSKKCIIGLEHLRNTQVCFLSATYDNYDKKMLYEVFGIKTILNFRPMYERSNEGNTSMASHKI